MFVWDVERCWLLQLIWFQNECFCFVWGCIWGVILEEDGCVYVRGCLKGGDLVLG